MFEAFFSSKSTRLEFIKANSIIKTPIITAIFSKPNRPPKNLFNNPKAAKSASLVNALPARIIERRINKNVIAKALIFKYSSFQLKCSLKKFAQ